jgi:hypothetical protein
MLDTKIEFVPLEFNGGHRNGIMGVRKKTLNKFNTNSNSFNNKYV